MHYTNECHRKDRSKRLCVFVSLLVGIFSSNHNLKATLIPFILIINGSICDVQRVPCNNEAIKMCHLILQFPLRPTEHSIVLYLIV